MGRQPQTSLPTPEQAKELATLDQQISSLQKRMKEYGVQFDGAVAEWETALTTQEIRRLPRDIQNVLRIDPNKRNANHRRSLHQWLSKRPATLVGYVDESGRGLASAMAKLQSQRAKLVKQIPTSLVTVAMTPRPIRVLPRGNWLDDSGPVVLPSVPDALPSLSSTKEKRLSRLDLAKWMFKKDNPLVGRVFVNRLWMLYFGEGLAKTLDDLGSQGAWPTHPELLDWLAIEFRDSGWDMQHMIKLMVTSSTYRQRSKATQKLRAIDPYNKLLARQGRWRLEAEMVRDNALAVSSLLQRKIGGPSVKPYQPAGYWQHLNFPRRTYKKSDGVNQYRRGLYTYWQRTFLHPSLMAFDATSREECTVQRPRSNTPQQALVLLNDPTYVEAARAFAEKIVAGAKDTPSRVRFAYRRALNREPRPVEIKLLSALFDKHLGEYEKDVKAAQRLLNIGDRPIPTDKQAPELAAWTSVARVILNLHETITRQ